MKLKNLLLSSILFFSIQIFGQEKIQKNQFGIEVVGYYPFQEQVSRKWEYHEVENVYMLQLNALMNRNISKKTDLVFAVGLEYLNSSEKDYGWFAPEGVDPTKPDYYQHWLKLSSHNFIVIASGALKLRGSSKSSYFYLKTGIDSRFGVDYFTSRSFSESIGKVIGGIDFIYGPKAPRLKIAPTLAIGRYFNFEKFNFFIEAKSMYLQGKLFGDSFGTNFKVVPIGFVVGSFF